MRWRWKGWKVKERLSNRMTTQDKFVTAIMIRWWGFGGAGFAGGCLSYGVSMPTSRSSSHPFGNSASKPLSRRVWERFLMKWALHLRQSHPSPENIQHSSSTQSCASSLLSHHPPFSEQSSATRVWHTTEYWLFLSTNNVGIFPFKIIQNSIISL